MIILGKRNIIGLAAGAVFLAGSVSPFVAEAAESDNLYRPAIEHRQVNSDKFAQDIGDTFGINKNDILTYHNQGIDFKDLFKASLLAKASNKSLKEVMVLKNYDNTWMKVAQSLGVTKEKMYTTHNDIEATQMEKTLSIPKKISFNLMKQGYHSDDIANANALAKITGKSISAILNMKKINNTWFQVSQSLSVNYGTFKQGTKEIKNAFPRIYFHNKYPIFTNVE